MHIQNCITAKQTYTFHVFKNHPWLCARFFMFFEKDVKYGGLFSKEFADSIEDGTSPTGLMNL